MQIHAPIIQIRPPTPKTQNFTIIVFLALHKKVSQKCTYQILIKTKIRLVLMPRIMNIMPRIGLYLGQSNFGISVTVKQITHIRPITLSIIYRNTILLIISFYLLLVEAQGKLQYMIGIVVPQIKTAIPPQSNRERMLLVFSERTYIKWNRAEHPRQNTAENVWQASGHTGVALIIQPLVAKEGATRSRI